MHAAPSIDSQVEGRPFMRRGGAGVELYPDVGDSSHGVPLPDGLYAIVEMALLLGNRSEGW